MTSENRPVSIPVILDTDIGMDVDDVWALAFLLRCPELDVKLVVSDSGNTRYSASVAAKLLTIAGRTDVPVGIGIPLDETPQTHQRWLDEYSVEDYQGRVFEDGIGAICDTIRSSDKPVTVIAIGPVPNIAAALARDPEIVNHSRLVAMLGSLRRGYLGATKPMREYNVKKHALAAQKVFATPWDITITPLDSCGTVALKGAAFNRLSENPDPLLQAVLDNHYGWFEAVADWPVVKDFDPHAGSSILYDTVAVYLAFAEELLEMEELGVIVTDDGKTLIDPAGQRIRCAMNWRDYEGFVELLSNRLAGGAPVS
jgi:inosine-uridine nucleoside N-ribohydrolase